MSNALDILLVAGLICAAAGYAFFSLAPNAWRAAVLAGLGGIAGRFRPFQRIGLRMIDRAAKLTAATGCGGCGDCGSGESSDSAAARAEVKIPVASIKRRR